MGLKLKPASQDLRIFSVTTPLGKDKLLFHSMEGTEGFSEAFAFTLDLYSANPNIDPEKLIGKPITVEMDLEDASSRFFNGHVVSFRQAPAEQGFFRYILKLRPWFWLLSKTMDCRIFQNQTSLEIMRSLFEHYGFQDFEFKTTQTYRSREYCVQYKESAFDFMSRLMEEEGIFYYFEHTRDRHIMVIADSPEGLRQSSLNRKSKYYPASNLGQRDEQHIHAWYQIRDFESGVYSQRDYDFVKPKDSLETIAFCNNAHAVGDLECFSYPGGYSNSQDGQAVTDIRMEEIATTQERFSGSGTIEFLQSGDYLNLEGHASDALNRSYVLTRTKIKIANNAYASTDAASNRLIEVEFDAIKRDRTFRPPRRTRKPTMDGPQTAKVVGKPGEEIWTNEHGQIKILFHWDRYGQEDDHASCWVRVSHPWAGKGWGALSIPRIGQEVIVDFIDGDPDRPIVTGRVYNSDLKPPFTLPGGAVTSGIKSATHKGNGYNELSMTDTAGDEKFLIHAQRDMETTVLNDQRNTIKAKRDTTIDASDHLEVREDQTIVIRGQQIRTVEKDQTTDIGGNQQKTISGSMTVNVDQAINQKSMTTTHLESFQEFSLSSTTSITLNVATSQIQITPTEISITMGASSIKVDALGVAISGPLISLNG